MKRRPTPRLASILVAIVATMASLSWCLFDRPPVPRVEPPRFGSSTEPTTSVSGAVAPPSPTDARRHRLSVTVLDVRGGPRANTLVEVIVIPDGAEDHDVLPPVAREATRVDGRVAFDLPESSFAIRIVDPSVFARLAFADVPETTDIEVRVSRGVRLRVRVVDESGRPIEGARVRDSWSGRMTGAITTADGVADLGALHPRHAFIWASKDGYLTTRRWFEHLGRHGEQHAGTMTLARGGTLVVRTRDAATGKPPGLCDIWIDAGPRGDLYREIGPDGHASYPGALVAPRLIVRGTAPDGRHAEARIDVDVAESRREVELLFAAGRVVAGKCLHAWTGTAVSGARVYLDDPWGQPILRAETGADGGFRIARAPGGSDDSIELHVEAPGLTMRESGNGDVRPGQGASGEILVELVPTGTLEGVVQDVRGEPVPGATVRVRSSGGGEPRIGAPLVDSTDAEGRFRIEGVPPQKHLVVLAEKPGLGVAWSDLVALDPGRSVDVLGILLPGTFRFSATVVDEAGAPVRCAWLWLRYRVITEGQRVVERIVEDGTFAPIAEIPRPGAVVEIDGPGFLEDHVRITPETSRIVLARPRRVSGRAARSPDNSPLANRKVVFLHATRPSSLPGNHASAETDALGHFEVAGLRAGRYRIVIPGSKLRSEVEVVPEGPALGVVRFSEP